MVSYQEGKIYRITCNKTGLTYYGSTCEKNLSSRLSHHMNNFKDYLENKFNYITSFKVFENGDYDIILVEKYPCKDRMELYQRERYYIENNECVNKIIPTRTKKEWREDNAEKIKEDKKDYYLENKEIIILRSKGRYDVRKDIINKKRKEKIICKCGREIRKADLQKHLRSNIHLKNIAVV